MNNCKTYLVNMNIRFHCHKVNADPDVHRLNLEISRLQEKIRSTDDRIEDLEGTVYL